ncbi:chloride channel protein [Aciditerrimonas ferrireducens]|uniref:chloride channel protein n=1 Tax=Aciditerrimonas ferrireducens TaxID=667306 RepID=UPI002003942D|nr:chloride channel protein [Aciditerrimonas ferrireducens]MCK4176032.1 chloride channel protein [Aciditerrimonas ferrireducens]
MPGPAGPDPGPQRPQRPAPSPSQRRRTPPPLFRRRLPSGRGAMEQPNVTHDLAPLTARFWATVVLVGVATGLLGDGLMAILFTTEHLAFGFHQGGSFLAAVSRASALRRVVVLALSGLLGSVAWFVLRRLTAGQHAEIDHALWRGDARLSVPRSLGTSVISEVVVGMGASIGREAAPKLMGGVAGSVVADWFRLTPEQRWLLVACGGGAGLACVYNVPLGGALFTAEVLVGTLSLPVALPALACSWVATVTAWLYLPRHATYTNVPTYHFAFTLLAFSLPAGVLIGVLAALLIRLVGIVSHHRLQGWRTIPASVLGFAALGALGIAYPQLFGNGKGMAHEAFLGVGTLGLFAALAALKPLATTMTLGVGASGGLFTPFMSTGAALGGFLGLAWSHLWPGAPAGAYATIGAAAMIGAAMQAPLAGLVLILELTHNGFELMVPVIAATVLATAVARQLDGYSIYSARLPALPPSAAPSAPEPEAA